MNIEMGQSSANQRLARFLKIRGITQQQFAGIVGTSQPTASGILSGKRPLSTGMVARVSNNFPDLNQDWLLTGEGEMLRQESEESNAVFLGNARRAMNDDLVDVRFFEVSPTATFQDFCAGVSEDPDTILILPQPNEHIDDSYCVFEVFGESMSPQIQNRARVLCREVSPSRWHTLHDCVIVIAYSDRFVIKRLAKNRLEAENYLTLSSDNPDYPDVETVQLSEIRTIFRAQRIISQQIS